LRCLVLVNRQPANVKGSTHVEFGVRLAIVLKNLDRFLDKDGAERHVLDNDFQVDF
jgi:hypothetical protein